jgi:fido (protein-threonine AMPylation protein)
MIKLDRAGFDAVLRLNPRAGWPRIVGMSTWDEIRELETAKKAVEAKVARLHDGAEKRFEQSHLTDIHNRLADLRKKAEREEARSDIAFKVG